MSAGGSQSSGDTRFERKGTALTSNFRELTPEHNSLFRRALSASAPGQANASVDQMLASRINSQVGSRPYAPEICSVIRSNLPNQPAPGEAMLKNTISQDPYSDTYAQNTFDRYAQDVQNSMSAARSGPQMTRGGTAAQGFAQAQVANDMGLNREQVVQDQRNRAITQGQQAAALLSGNRHTMNADAIAGAQQGQSGFYSYLQNMLGNAGLASERSKMFNDLVPAFATLGSKNIGTEQNDLFGRGSQTSSSFGASMNLCCFIFMEAYNGQMPWYVRACRDEFAPESSARRVGYIRMSRWLVPAMRVNGFTRKLVNHLLIQPLSRWGACYKGASVGWPSWTDTLAKNFWFKFWELTGK